MTGEDPNSLIGLPLIKLVGMLINEGIDPLLHAQKPASGSDASQAAHRIYPSTALAHIDEDDQHGERHS